MSGSPTHFQGGDPVYESLDEAYMLQLREGSKKKYSLLVGPCEFEILRPNLNLAVDYIGPETDFTLETDGKMCTKNK